MSINVLNHKHAVKTKVVICASLVLVVVLSLAEAGPRAGVRSGVFPPVICRTWPVFYYPAYPVGPHHRSFSPPVSVTFRLLLTMANLVLPRSRTGNSRAAYHRLAGKHI
jgi:hypothetical protein